MNKKEWKNACLIECNENYAKILKCFWYLSVPFIGFFVWVIVYIKWRYFKKYNEFVKAHNIRGR